MGTGGNGIFNKGERFIRSKTYAASAGAVVAAVGSLAGAAEEEGAAAAAGAAAAVSVEAEGLDLSGFSRLKTLLMRFTYLPKLLRRSSFVSLLSMVANGLFGGGDGVCGG